MRVALAVIALLLAPPVAARADGLTWDGPPEPASPAKPTREVSYGYQTLISDVAAAALLTDALVWQNGSDEGLGMALAGMYVYALGAPVVHVANGRIVQGIWSFGMRGGLAALGMLAGSQIGPKDTAGCDAGSSCPDSRSSWLGSAIGAGVGALTATVIDARFFARKRVEVSPAVAPSLGYSSRAGVSLGLTGSF